MKKFFFIIILIFINSSCSFIFVKKSPPESEWGATPTPLCTDRAEIPALDSLISFISGASAACCNTASPYCCVIVSLPIFVGFLSSAFYGFQNVSQCVNMKKTHGLETYHESNFEKTMADAIECQKQCGIWINYRCHLPKEPVCYYREHLKNKPNNKSKIKVKDPIDSFYDNFKPTAQ